MNALVFGGQESVEPHEIAMLLGNNWVRLKNAVALKLQQPSLRMIRLYDLRHAFGTLTYHRTKDVVFTQRQMASQQVVFGNSQVLGVFLSPDGGCEAEVVRWIQKANSSIHILIYSFTLDAVGDALIAAHSRNIDVKVVFEESQISVYSQYSKLHNSGIDARNDTNSKLMHDKVMVVDGIVVLTGSFNWSNSAEESNNENLIVVWGNDTASVYQNEFWKIWNTSI